LNSGSFNVVLVEPEIPPNTGNIGRLCLATDATLHLVHPLGFTLDERNLRRAGLDYWEHVRVLHHRDLAAFQNALAPTDRIFFLSTKGSAPYWDATFHPGDWLIFGRETKGLPESLLAAHPDRVLTIPTEADVRSLNLATAVGIVLFEAVRQVKMRLA
jgi:tRNA (cytidine/uridine-2'-O-)-methyltransferase